MPTLNSIVVMLVEQRRQLLEQLAAVDKAIAALSGAEAVAPIENVAAPVSTSVPAPAVASVVAPVEPRRVKSKRMLDDEHKEALNAGRRKAREAREVSKGLAREMPDEGFVPAIGTRRDEKVPRLVKRPRP